MQLIPGYKINILSSLAKVLPNEKSPKTPKNFSLTALRGETVSFQAAYIGKQRHTEYGRVVIESDLGKAIKFRSVENVPVNKPCNAEYDDNYISTEAGLYPDLLRNNHDDLLIFLPGQWRSIWIDVDVDASIAPGDHKITVSIQSLTGDELCSASVVLTVYACKLIPQTLMHTEWFHFDCLADYYHVEPWSEEHWKISEAFIKAAVKRGVNMILTPIHTPPLDTYIGGERTTVQLVDVTVTHGIYSFGFEKFERFIEICQKCGVEYYEMAHLFTQWGAKAAPKIIGIEDGNEKQLFGWDTPAVGGAYTRFLQEYLKALRFELQKLGISNVTYFHISDEPSSDNIDNYIAARNSVSEVLEDANIIDALSDFEFYKRGVITKPIPANNHIEAFIDGGVKDLWTYYCTSQCVDVSNRFIAMPSARNRAIGIQFYLYRIEGFLQWGYNFYNSMESRRHINPYLTTDAMAFPAGDPFMVYPGSNGKPEESIRFMVFYEALTDLRALNMLESLTSRMFVENLINENTKSPITFKSYPRDDEYYLNLRRRVNEEIAKFSAKN